jgi:tetratricopeptide (TPR) repeat protein
MRILLAASLACVVLGAAAAPATAADDQNSTWCVGGRGISPDLRIGGCTAVIQSGRETAQDLATDFKNRGEAYEAKRDYAHAVADFDQALQLKADYADAYIERANTYYLENDYLHAIADFDRALRLKPDSAGIYIDRGIIYLDKDDFEDAVADFSEAIRLDPNSSPAYNNRCLARVNHGRDLDQALSDCNATLRLHPDIYALRIRAFVYYRLGRYDEAIADATAALAGDPKFAHALYVRGLAWAAKGDRARGSADMAAAKAIYPKVADDYARYGAPPPG